MPVPISLVADVLQDVPTVISCIPGASVTRQLSVDRFAGEIGVRHGDSGITFRGEFEVVRGSATRMRIVASGAGGEHLGVRSVVDLVLDEEGRATKMSLAIQLEFSGALSGFAQFAARAACPALLASFAANLAAQVTPKGWA